jgi:hypothetical protein
LVWAERRQADGGTLLLRADYTYDVWGRRIEKTVDPDGAGPQPAGHLAEQFLTLFPFGRSGWSATRAGTATGGERG